MNNCVFLDYQFCFLYYVCTVLFCEEKKPTCCALKGMLDIFINIIVKNVMYFDIILRKSFGSEIRILL